jgi:hypothetical protein
LDEEKTLALQDRTDSVLLAGLKGGEIELRAQDAV